MSLGTGFLSCRMSSLGDFSTFLDGLCRCVTLSGREVGILGLFTRDDDEKKTRVDVKMWVGPWA